jgi:hypothetical protein
MTDINSMAERVRLITDPAYTPPDPSTLVLGQCGYCFVINGHAETCLRSAFAQQAAVRDAMLNAARETLLHPAADPSNAPLQFGTLAQQEPSPAPIAEYARPVITRATGQWLQAVLCTRKLELLREKRHYLKTRGSDVTRFANMLEEIERDLAHINELQDALT